MSDQFVAEIRMFGCNFPTRGWAFCNGQLMAITQNTALFSLVGTQFGGNGQSTFALPDLQVRVPLAAGQGPGLTPYNVGDNGGENSVTLTGDNLPNHGHALMASSAAATTGAPSGAATLAVSSQAVYAAPQSLVAMAPVGGPAAPHNNMQPHVALNFCIALQGIYPARS